MLEIITTAVSTLAFTLGVVKFIVSRHDKRVEKQEEVISQMKQQIEKINETSKDNVHKIDTLEKGYAKFEVSIDRQMQNLDDKLEKIYAFLLQSGR